MGRRRVWGKVLNAICHVLVGSKKLHHIQELSIKANLSCCLSHAWLGLRVSVCVCECQWMSCKVLSEQSSLCGVCMCECVCPGLSVFRCVYWSCVVASGIISLSAMLLSPNCRRRRRLNRKVRAVREDIIHHCCKTTKPIYSADILSVLISLGKTLLYFFWQLAWAQLNVGVAQVKCCFKMNSYRGQVTLKVSL